MQGVRSQHAQPTPHPPWASPACREHMCRFSAGACTHTPSHRMHPSTPSLTPHAPLKTTTVLQGRNPGAVPSLLDVLGLQEEDVAALHVGALATLLLGGQVCVFWHNLRHLRACTHQSAHACQTRWNVHTRRLRLCRGSAAVAGVTTNACQTRWNVHARRQ